MLNMKLALVIPVYNEEKYLRIFLKELQSQVRVLPEIISIVIVNDGSTDATIEIIRKNFDNLHLISHKKNLGKGSAMKTGLNYVKKRNFDGLIFMDADRQHNPKHLKTFVSALQNNQLVFGYRKLSRREPAARRLGNQLARFIFRNFFHIARHDLLCGFMGIKSSMFNAISWQSTNYGVETEISAIVGKKRLPFKEALIDTIYMDKNKGVTLLDAFFILMRVPYWYVKY